MNPENRQRQYVEFQLVDQQIKQLQQQLLILEQQAGELTNLSNNLEDLKKVKPKTKSFSNLGPGVFVESTLEDTKHVLMDIGAEVRVKKTIPDAQKIINKQTEEIAKVTKNVEEQIQKLIVHAQKIQKELQEEQKE